MRHIFAISLPASLNVRTEPQSEIGRNRRKKKDQLITLPFYVSSVGCCFWFALCFFCFGWFSVLFLCLVCVSVSVGIVTANSTLCGPTSVYF